ncbi:hypothetical protein [Bradyrhizobium frederickii]|uniref:hypothetical protein n=1 Tax=Bradyrhizobium frederickii TaxID=2560054 RepID=UPI003D310FDD
MKPPRPLSRPQREADALIGETLECYDDGAIEQDELAAFALVLGLLSNAIADRRAALQRANFETVRGAATAPRG